MKSSCLWQVCIAATLSSVVLFNSESRAENWIGANSTVYNVTVPPGTIGWDTTVPNGVGAVAQKIDAFSGTVTIDVGGVTLGTISLGGTSDVFFGVTPTAGLTLDKDGAGAGVAVISNTNTSAGTNPGLILGAGTITLADNLLISNTSASNRTTGAIIINSVLTGAVGNVTIESNSNAFPVSTASFAGAIRLTGANTFLAPVAINKGTVTFSTASAFGDASNSLTIGKSGAGLGATVISTAAVLVPQNITIAGSTGGTTILGSNNTSAATTGFGYSGTITLNGNLTTTGASLTGTGPNFSGNISGVGGITHFGNTTGPAGPNTLGNATLSGVNSYTGVTTINSGNLQFAQKASLYGGNTASWTSSNLVVNASGVATFYVGGTGQFTASDIDSLKSLGTASGGFKNGSGIGLNTAAGNFTYASNITNTNGGANSIGFVKYGANTLTLSGTNSYSGITVAAEGTLQFATRASLYNATPASWTATNLTTYSGATSLFNVGGPNEFTVSDIQSLITLGTPTVGFLSGSSIGLDTTNAAAETVYNTAITNTNGGANTLGLAKIGANTLTLTGANTYTGNTVVDGGTLKITGSHAGGTSSYRVGRQAGREGTIIIDNAGTPPTITAANMSIGDASLAAGGIGHVEQANGNITLSTYLAIGNNDGTTGTYHQTGGSVFTTNTSTGNGVIVGWWGNGSYTMDGGSMTSRSWVTVGYGDGATHSGTGVLTLNNGTILVNDDGTGGGAFGLGRTATGDGTLIMNNGTLTVNNDWFVIGISGKGAATLNNGTINTFRFEMCQNATGTGNFTMNGGAVNVTGSIALIGDNGVAQYKQTGGNFTVSSPGQRFSVGEGVNGSGTFDMSGGSIKVTSDWFIFARNGMATGTLSGTGAITAGAVAMFSEFATANSNFTMQGGTLKATNWFLGGQGTSTFTQTGGAITTTAFSSLARSATGNGHWIMSGGSFNNTSDMNIGDNGTGLLDMTGGSISAGAFILGWNASAKGTVNLSGTGAITTTGWSYVGRNGEGIMSMNGGTYDVGDNFTIGDTISGKGTMTITNGTVTIHGNAPSYTGNLKVGTNGLGTLNIDGGVIDLVTPPTPTEAVPLGTNNSASFSIANSEPGSEYNLAQDGNLRVGEVAGIGTVTQSAGLMKIAANIYLGGSAGGKGTFTITGGETRVGITSPTGGDVVIGGAGSGSEGTLNLQGGILNVANGKIGAQAGTAAFNFTGGTLKVKEYNAGDFGGSMSPLVQNGATSVLDATGNNTTLFGGYTLTAGSALVGAGRTLASAGAMSVASAGTVQSAGLVSVTGNLSVASGGQYVWQLAALSTSNPGTDFGQIQVSGNLDLLAGAKLSLDFGLLGANGPNSSNAFWHANHSWTIIDTNTNTSGLNFSVFGTMSFASGTFSTSVVGGDIVLNFATSTPGLSGDFDSDGDVDGADFIAWQTHYPTASGATLATGDANGDGKVDAVDFNLWKGNFPTSPSPVATVPEPGSVILLGGVSLLALAGYRRRLSRQAA